VLFLLKKNKTKKLLENSKFSNNQLSFTIMRIEEHTI